MNQLTIIGGGPGSADCLLPAAKKAIDEAGYVYADRRYLFLAAHRPSENFGPMQKMPEIIREKLRECPVAVIVSGDPLFYSLTKLLCAQLPAQQVTVIPGISSVQYLAAACGRTLEQAAFFSCHGRSAPWREMFACLSKGRDLYVLCDSSCSPDWLAGQLCAAGYSQIQMAAGSRLSYPDERIVLDTAGKLKEQTFDPLSVAAVFAQAAPETDRTSMAGRAQWQRLWKADGRSAQQTRQEAQPQAAALLTDDLFFRERIPMTRQELRWVILGKLGLRPGAVVWDIGAGTGAVSAECAHLLAVFGSGYVYSIERDEAACRLIERNAARLGLQNLILIHGQAPQCLAGLPLPDCVFVGGSGGSLEGILSHVRGRGDGIRIVTACVTMETQADAFAAYYGSGFGRPDITQVQIARGKELGHYHLLESAHPVTLFTACTGKEAKEDV